MDSLIYKGFITLVKRTFRGRDWEVIKSKPAVSAVLLNPDKTCMLLVKQYRVAVQKEVWEIPAGMMDVDGENPCNCIVRELQEEADIKVDPSSLTKIIGYHPHIGCCDAYVEIFSGIAEQTYIGKIIHDEDVTEARWFTLDEVEEMIEDGLIVDGKTILAYLKVS